MAKSEELKIMKYIRLFILAIHMNQICIMPIHTTQQCCIILSDELSTNNNKYTFMAFEMQVTLCGVMC